MYSDVLKSCNLSYEYLNISACFACQAPSPQLSTRVSLPTLYLLNFSLEHGQNGLHFRTFNKTNRTIPLIALLLGSIQVEEILVAAACFLHHINLTTVSVYHLLTYCYDCNVVMRMEGVESVDLTGDASCAWIIFRHLLVTCWSLYCLAPSSICACMVGRIVDVVHNQSLYVEHHGSLTRKPQ